MTTGDTTQAVEISRHRKSAFEQHPAGLALHTAGYCVVDNLRYLWPRRTGRLADAHCPNCRRRLSPTVWYAAGEWVVLDRRP